MLTFQLNLSVNLSIKLCLLTRFSLKHNRFYGLFRRNICSAGLNRLRYSNLIAVKSYDFFGETLPQTFVTRGLINSDWFSPFAIANCHYSDFSLVRIITHCSCASNVYKHKGTILQILQYDLLAYLLFSQ